MNLKLMTVMAALVAAMAPAQAGTKISQISASIVLLGDPAPTLPAAAAEKAPVRQAAPDVLAGGEFREGGVSRPVAKAPVADEETTSAVDASSEGGPVPLEDSELRLGE